MVEKFLENIVAELNEKCMNKESKTFIRWNLNDINLDINKCKKHCDIDSGYMWNGIKMCESCDKILHTNLDRFTKSNIDIIFDNMILEEKIKKLETNNEILNVQYDYLKSMNTIMEDKLNYLHKVINNIKNDINDISNIKNDINNIKNDINDINNIKNDINNIKNNINEITENINENIDKNINSENNNIMIENLLQAYEIKFKNMSNEHINNAKKLENNFNDFTNNVYNIIDGQINKKINNYNKIIDKQVEYQNFDNKINYTPKANIKIFDKCRVGGIGYILNANTVSNGNVKPGYTYQSKSNENLLFKIKDFENNSCPQEFNYPASNILIVPQFIKGNYKDVELYDEFLCVKTD